MYPTHIALVPYAEGLVAADELLLVAATLQTQVTRDLGPAWGLSGVLSPFLALEDVPPGYTPLVLVDGLPRPWHGFHILEDGQPIGLVGYQKGWSLLASHELMELLCDPWGNRRVPGRSLRKEQGQVEYLVEVCDPCQLDEYAINGVPLSDFVTPRYYGPAGTQGARYCFTGRIKSPLALGRGGSISWRTADGEIWQKSGDGDPRQLEAATFSRASVGSHPARGRPDVADKLPKGRRSRGPYYRHETSARRYGTGLKTGVDRILEQLGAKPPVSSLDAIVKLLEGLAKEGSSTRKEFEKDPAKALKKLGLDPPPNLDELELAPAEHYHGILAAIEGGLGLGDPKLAAWLSTHGTLMHAGIE